MKKKALIIVDHGSVVKEANDMLLEISSLLSGRDNCGFDIIRPCHMELAEPTIAQAVDECVRQGAQEIVVHPYFLAPGRHSTQDIPRMVKEAAEKYPEVAYHVTEPLGVHAKLIDVILERVNVKMQDT